MAMTALALLGLLVACQPAEEELVRCDEDSVGFLPDSPLAAPCGGPVITPSTSGGPAFSRLELATSSDAEDWERLGLVLTRLADVPSCLTTEEGLWVYLVLWEDGEGTMVDRAVVAHTAELEAWSLSELSLDGLPEGYRGLVDPAVVALEDEPGEHRLYGVAAIPGELTRVFAWRSLGLDAWELEPAGGPDGALAWDDERNVIDPSVLWLDELDSYWLFAGGGGPGGHRRATSEDGLVLEHLEPRLYTTPEGATLKPSHGLGARHWAFETAQDGGRGRAIWRMDWEGEDWVVQDTPDMEVEEGSLGDAAVCPDPRGEGYVMIYATDL